VAKTSDDHVYRGLGSISNEYEIALIATWRAARSAAPSADDVPFSKEDLVRHGDEIRKRGITERALAVKNIPDIIYTYRARAELPDEILKIGHYAIIGRGKGLYSFARINRPNRILLPRKRKLVRVKNAVPEWARQFMTEDEQGMLTAMANNDLVARHLQLKRAFRLQSHLRCGVDGYGQVEIDELYVGEDSDGRHVVVAVEAKDRSDHDLLNISQLYGSGRALRHLFPEHDVRLLGAKPVGSQAISLCQFRVSQKPMDVAEIGDWVDYQLD
jgi:hypothetical protein